MRIGPYEVEQKLAEGGMAEVLLARGPGGRRVVLKRALRAADTMAQRRLRDEGRLGQRLNGTGFVETLELLEDNDGAAVVALEWIDGVPIEGLWKVARLTPWMASKIGAEVAGALATLHELEDAAGQNLGAVHRDLSSRNVMIDADGRARVIDLGCALFDDAERSARTDAGNVLGTLRYLAPEVFENAKACQASDVWSLGVVLLEGALGRPVFKGKARDVAAAVWFQDPFADVDVQALDPRLLGVLKHLIRREPTTRPTAARAAEELVLLADGLVSEAKELRALVERARGAIVAGLIQVGTSQPSPGDDATTTSTPTVAARPGRLPTAVVETTERDGSRRDLVNDDEGPTTVDIAREEESVTARVRRDVVLSMEVDTPVRPMFREAPFVMPSDDSVAGVFTPGTGEENVPIRRRSQPAILVPVHTIHLVDVPDIDDGDDHTRSIAKAWPKAKGGAPLGKPVAPTPPPLPIDPKQAEATVMVRHERPPAPERAAPGRGPASVMLAAVIVVVVLLLVVVAARLG